MISQLSIKTANWRQALCDATAQMKLVVWSECDGEVVEAWSCDTRAEALSKSAELEDFGEVFMTEEHRA